MEVVFHRGRLPWRLSAMEVVFHGGRLPSIQNFPDCLSSIIVDLKLLEIKFCSFHAISSCFQLFSANEVIFH